MTAKADSIAVLLDRISCRVALAGRQTMQPAWNLAPRSLPFHDVIFVERGTGCFRVGMRRVDVCAPAWIILPAGIEHQGEGSGLRLAVVHFEARMGEKLDALRVFASEDELSPRLPPSALTAFQQAIDAWKEETPVGRVCANRAMEQWFARAFGGSASVPAVVDARLVEALAWFQAHADRPILMEEAARHVGVSEPHLRSLFSRHLGISPKKALQDIRLSRAREALENGSAGVAEAAYRAGWEDVSGFSRTFRRHFGISPGAFRRQRSP